MIHGPVSNGCVQVGFLPLAHGMPNFAGARLYAASFSSTVAPALRIGRHEAPFRKPSFPILTVYLSGKTQKTQGDRHKSFGECAVESIRACKTAGSSVKKGHARLIRTC